MRIALVSPYDLGVPGGVQSHVRALATALSLAGDEVLVVGPGRDDGAARDAGRMRAVVASAAPAAAAAAATPSVHEVRVGRSLAVAFNGSRAPVLIDPRGIARARAAIAEVDAEIVHVHEPLVPLLGPGIALADGRPLVTTNHAWSDRARLYRAVRPLGRRVLSRAAAALVVSEAARTYHAAALGLPRERFTVVPNGVDVARFAGAEPAPRERGRRRVLFVGRLEPRKGVRVLARAFAELAAERPDLELVVVGTGPDAPRVRDLAGADAPVRMLGSVAQADLPAVVASADVVVAPSLGGESFGIVLAEAMAAGRPLVASDLPGYRSVVAAGDEAVLVPPGDASALRGAIARVLDDAALAAALVAAGRRRVAELDWTHVAARVRSHYVAAVSGRASTGPDASV